MKTSYSYLKRTCLFLALFSWLLPMNLKADVTVEWGDWGSPVILLPSATSSTVDNITVSTDLPTYTNAWLGGGNPHAYNTGGGGIIDIQTANGLVITQVSAAIWYGSSVRFTIDFASTDSYSAGSSLGGQEMAQHNQGDPTLTNITAPANARSARITSTGSDGWGGYLYRLVVTAEAASCANPIDASFAKEGSETGSVPAAINSCAGNNIIIPDQGSLAKTGCDFVGWSYNSTTYAPGASFTMPATNVTFTAVWEQHYVPAVTNLNSSVSGSDVTLTWTNYNKMKIDPSLVQLSPGATSSNAAITGWSVTNGVFDVSYETTAVDHYATIEIKLPKEINHVSSIGFDYIFNSSITGGGLLPYMMYNGDAPNNPWGAYWTDYTAHDATSYTSFTITPDNAGMWGWLMTSGTYDPTNKIHLVGFMINPHEASSGTFSIKDIYINTSDGQTLLDEVIVVRKEGSAPASVSDGTQVYNGLLNTCTDNSLADGDYYYAVFAREGDAYSAAVVEQVHIGAVAPTLTYYERTVAPGEYGTVCIGYAVEHENISGATMFEIDEWSADGKTLTLSELGASEAMVAGRPYIFLASASTLSLGYDGSASEAPAGAHNGLRGSYAEAQIAVNDDNYIIYNNKLYPVVQPARVGANRAYIHKETASPSSAPRRRVTLAVEGTNATTGIDQLSSTPANGKFIKEGQLFIIRDGRTYNAQGIEIK